MPKIKEVFKWVNWVEQRIYPFARWTPGENTVAYLPLDWDTSFEWVISWVTSWSDISWETIQWSLKWIKFKWNSNSYLLINGAPELNTDFTFNLWCKLDSLSDVILVDRWTSTSTNCNLHYIIRSSWHTADLWFYSNDCAWTTALNTWTWYNLCATYNYNTREQKVYINWTLDWSRTWSWNPSFWTWDMSLWWNKVVSNNWNRVNGIMSNFIRENKVRTIDEISSYYNKTKWNYWL